MKLKYRVPLLTLGIMLVIGLLIGGSVLYFQRKSDAKQFEDTATAMATSIVQTLDHFMLTGEPKEIQDTVTSLAHQPLVSEVLIYTKDGTVFASGDASEIGLKRDDPRIQETLRSGKASAKTESTFGSPPHFDVVFPVFNRPECYGCHSSDNEALGAIEVGLSTVSWSKEQAQQTLIMVLLGGIGIILVGGMTILGFQRIILNPLAGLGKAAQKISGGDYTARAEANEQDDEVGVVVRAFNEMAQRVYDQTLQLAQWNLDLEEKVALRTKELSALNAVLTAASESLDLRQALEETIDTLLQVMSMDGAAILLVDAESESMKLVAHRGFSKKLAEGLRRLPVDESLAGYALRSAQTMVTDDVSTDPRLALAAAREDDLHTAVITPIRGTEGVIGILGVASHLHRSITPDEIRLLEAVAGHVGIVVDNITLYQREQQQRAEAQILAAALTQETARLLDARQGIMQSLLAAVEARDPYTRGHSDRVREYARSLARRLGLDEPEVEIISSAAQLHDLGKIAISDTILLKQARLTPPEWTEVTRHSEKGEELIRLLGFLEGALPIVRGHHERFDGEGYPDNLAGETIPLGARILAVADAYDALTTTRPYRRAFSHDEAVDMLQNGAGTQWDPEIVETFLGLLAEIVSLERLGDEGRGTIGTLQQPAPAGPR
ncbi:MAG: GAF domain-containing protein [Chloroflexi bacterium]|nr:GAF domain-containing protein [Chloroflexota bacterium]